MTRLRLRFRGKAAEMRNPDGCGQRRDQDSQVKELLRERERRPLELSHWGNPSLHAPINRVVAGSLSCQVKNRLMLQLIALRPLGRALGRARKNFVNLLGADLPTRGLEIGRASCRDRV